MIISMAACILRFDWGGGMVTLTGACSCVCGRKGGFKPIPVFSDVENCIAYYAALQRENLRSFFSCLVERLE